MLCYIIIYPSLLYCSILYPNICQYTKLCYTILYYAIQYGMFCHTHCCTSAVLCYILYHSILNGHLCYAMLCYAMLGCQTSPGFFLLRDPRTNTDTDYNGHRKPDTHTEEPLKRARCRWSLIAADTPLFCALSKSVNRGQSHELGILNSFDDHSSLRHAQYWNIFTD